MLENLEYTETTEENHKIEQFFTYYCTVSFSIVVSPRRAMTLRKSLTSIGASVEARDGNPGRFYARSSRDIIHTSESSGRKAHGLQCVPLQP